MCFNKNDSYFVDKITTVLLFGSYLFQWNSSVSTVLCVPSLAAIGQDLVSMYVCACIFKLFCFTWDWQSKHS